MNVNTEAIGHWGEAALLALQVAFESNLISSRTYRRLRHTIIVADFTKESATTIKGITEAITEHIPSDIWSNIVSDTFPNLRGSTQDNFITPSTTKRKPNEIEISPQGKPTKRLRFESMEGGDGNNDTQMLSADSGGFTNKTSKETPIDKFRYAFRGLPSTATTVLRYIDTGSLSITTGQVGTLKYRMNSIYDVKKTTSGGFDTGSSNLQQPAWRAHFVNYYDYYTVLGCKWTVSVLQTTERYDKEAAIFEIYSGNTDIPITYSTSVYMGWQDFMQWTNKKVHYTTPQDEMITAAGAQPPRRPRTISFNGYYKPGMFDREVRDDDKAKTWIAIDDAPTLYETLNLIFVQGPLSTLGAHPLDFNYAITLDYLVQFKDLKTQFLYPTPDTTEFKQITDGTDT